MALALQAAVTAPRDRQRQQVLHDVPLTSHLLTLHYIIQIAFGWTIRICSSSLSGIATTVFRAKRTNSGASRSIGRQVCGCEPWPSATAGRGHDVGLKELK